MGHLGVQKDKNYIIAGVENNAHGNYCEGWVIIGSELLHFQSGDRTDKVEVMENTRMVTFKTGQTHPVYLEKFARFAQGEGLRIEDFIRIKTPEDLDESILKNNQDTKDLSSKTDNEFTFIKNKLSSIEEDAQKNVQPDWNDRLLPP